MPPKYQAIADELRIHIEAGKYAGSDSLPTEFAIAEEYRVSRQTVRQALALLVSDGLIEKRQGSGSKIVRHKVERAGAQPLTIAVVTTHISDYIFPSILREVENTLAQNNCTPTLFSTQNQVDSERKILKNILSMPVSGVLVEGSKTALPNPNIDLYRQLLDKGLPLVFMHGAYGDVPGALTVLDDNVGGGRMLVEYLYGRGHRSIAGIFKSDDIQGVQRYAGYIDALRDLNLPLDDRNVFWYDTQAKERLLNGQGAMERVDEALSGCSAVVCYNDEIANRIVSYLIKKGLRVPEDMAVVSFDNSQYSELSPVRITSLSHGKYNVGRMSAALLIRMLNGEPCRSETAPWELIEKESS